MKKVLFTTILLLFYTYGVGQQLFDSGIFYGGVTGGGFSTNTGSGSVTSIVSIPPNSTVKKAFLIATRNGSAPNISVVLNGMNYIFTDSSIVSNYFTSFVYSWTWSNSTIHALDITNDIDSSITNYNLIIPPQFNITVNGFYSTFYLYIVYENITLPKIAYNLFINQQNVAPISNYNLAGFSQIDNSSPVALALMCYFFCDTIQDGSYVAVNSNNIGLLGGQESNTLNSCTGTYANFAHYNDTLFGLEDDTPDSLMVATDALADIKSYVNNGDTAVDITFTYQSNWGPFSNPIAAMMLSYATPCDTFSTSITANDTLCLGESLQLNATGGVNYSWFGAFSGLSDTTIANPIATPTQTTTYICTITNDSGCVKTEQVKIWVNPLPMPDTLIVTNNICGDSVGSLTIGNIPNGTTPFNYQLTNLQTLITQNSSLTTFSNLGTGNYQLTITDSNGCQFTDTITITETNNVVANFTSNPSSGIAPLSVDFTNTSVNANAFMWWVVSGVDTLSQDSSLNTQHLFENSGNFQICLIAYNNLAICADTICKTIIVTNDTAITFIIPNVFTPNFDGNNDNFVIQLTGTSLIAALKVEVFNRWGQLLRSNEFSPFDSAQGANSQNTSPTTQYTIWDGRTTAGKLTPEGTYFYVITYTLKDDASATLSTRKGSITLLR